ncbi:MAG TPA: amidase [Candidatus Binataceae bacterium]|nr:amidase [Candidatus Binataceae bacterium]
MSNSELLSFDVTALSEQVRSKRISPVEITDAYLNRIEETDSRLRAYITVTAEHARTSAKTAENEIAGGKWRGPFHGIPVALKDLCYTKGILTTGGSKIFANLVPDFDCTVWARLQAAGAVLLGKLNLHEFAAGATTTNPHFGACRNPYALDRIPGGSSGGSAAAIVAHSAAATIGTDTGGSIRIPAAFCGCVGMKQTWSRVSRYGVMPLADSLDHAGPITRTVRDAALMLQKIAGHDPNDPTSSREEVPDFSNAIARSLKGARIGVIRELMEGLSNDVASCFQVAMTKFRESGASVDEVSIPSINQAPAIATSITFAEAAEFHENWIRSRPQDYGFDVRRTLEAGMLTPAMYYVRAQRARAVILAEALAALENRIALVAPTASIAAPRIAAIQPETALSGRANTLGIERKLPTTPTERVDLVSAVLRFTAPFNITGQPALALPIGLSPDGLPLSMQIIGRPFDEATVFQVASAYEQARGALPDPKL